VNEIEKRALVDSIQADLNAVYANDAVKPVVAPFHTLGAKIVDKLPCTEGQVLVLSDLGLLVAVLRRFKPEQVTFVAHTTEQEQFSQSLVVKTWQVGYNDPITQLEKLCMGLKFDIIVGNPPYQEESKEKKGESTRAAERLWEQFLALGLDTLVDDGYLLFVTPATWLAPTSKSYGRLKKVQVLEANVASSVKDSFQGVGGSMRFSWYLVRNSARVNSTKVTFDDGVFDLDLFSLPFAPVRSTFGMDYAICQKLAASGVAPLPWIRRERPGQKGVLEVAIPRAKSPSWTVRCHDDGTGEGYIFSPKNREEGEIVAHNLNHKLYRRCRWTMRSGMALVSSITRLPIHTDKKLDSSELYARFGFSQEEIDLIESTV